MRKEPKKALLYHHDRTASAPPPPCGYPYGDNSSHLLFCRAVYSAGNPVVRLFFHPFSARPPLEEGAGFLSATLLGTAMPTEEEFATLRAWDGLSGHDPATRRLYASLLFPADLPFIADQLAASLSSCALTGLAAYRAYGIVHAALRRPYAGHTDAVSLIVAIAKFYGAWVTPSAQVDPPKPGDIVLVTSPEHVFCLVGTDPAAGALLSIEGGQGPLGAAIGLGQRLLVWYDNELWGVRPASPYLAGGRPNGRRVVGWADVTAMTSRLRPTNPEGLRPPPTDRET